MWIGIKELQKKLGEMYAAHKMIGYGALGLIPGLVGAAPAIQAKAWSPVVVGGVLSGLNLVWRFCRYDSPLGVQCASATLTFSAGLLGLVIGEMKLQKLTTEAIAAAGCPVELAGILSLLASDVAFALTMPCLDALCSYLRKDDWADLEDGAQYTAMHGDDQAVAPTESPRAFDSVLSSSASSSGLGVSSPAKS